jgi:hypothetical protein
MIRFSSLGYPKAVRVRRTTDSQTVGHWGVIEFTLDGNVELMVDISPAQAKKLVEDFQKLERS